MPRYTVQIAEREVYTFIVDASNKTEAEEKAYNMFKSDVDIELYHDTGSRETEDIFEIPEEDT